MAADEHIVCSLGIPNSDKYERMFGTSRSQCRKKPALTVASTRRPNRRIEQCIQMVRRYLLIGKFARTPAGVYAI